jgi:hypothetical protein
MKIKVELKPTAENLVRQFKGFEGILLNKIKEGVLGYALLVKRGAMEEAPVDTGRLRTSISEGMRIHSGGLTAVIQPNVDYAYWVHQGTRSHVILPKNKKALYWKGAEHPVKRVNHPGTKPNPFMVRGVERYENEGYSYFLGKVDQAIKILSAMK